MTRQHGATETSGKPSTVIVVAGGGPPAPGAARGLPADALVIAADSGVDHALALDLHVDLAVGDMDSVSPRGLAAAEAAGTKVERHPEAKDQTDLELALDLALAAGASRVVVLGDDGGRLDHLLAIALLLGDRRYSAASIEARLGPAHLAVLHGGDDATLTLHGRPGDVVTLLPLHGRAGGVTTEHLLYPLRDEDLPPATTRGVSNQLLTPTAHVHLRTGTLLALRPGG